MAKAASSSSLRSVSEDPTHKVVPGEILPKKVDRGDNPILTYEKTIRISPDKMRQFKESLEGSTLPPIGTGHSKKWYPSAKIATPEFKIDAYNTRGELKSLRLEAWICLDHDDDGNHSILPMLIDNGGKEENGTGTAVNGTHPDFRMGTMPEFFVFFYGGAKIILNVKEKE